MRQTIGQLVYLIGVPLILGCDLAIAQDHRNGRLDAQERQRLRAELRESQPQLRPHAAGAAGEAQGGSMSRRLSADERRALRRQLFEAGDSRRPGR